MKTFQFPDYTHSPDQIPEWMKNIPEHAEGYPRPGWFTDEDWKKLHRSDRAAVRERYRENF